MLPQEQVLQQVQLVQMQELLQLPEEWPVVRAHIRQ
jgi:hypothetical protein